jgi:glyoxylase-like metal-dependent hydrolase (beta-lactamase superfamily II)
MFVKQMLVGPLDVFCYLVGCTTTRIAAVIDPGGTPELILQEAKKTGFSIRYIVNTHRHNDHTAGNALLKALTGAQIIMHAFDAAKSSGIDIHLKDEAKLRVGELEFQIIHTPGHTPGGICLYADGQLFTGDTLFVGDSGRTDLPGGDRKTLGASLRRLMQLPDQTVVWPGHDYGPTKSSTIGWEKRHNVNAKEYGFFVK